MLARIPTVHIESAILPKSGLYTSQSVPMLDEHNEERHNIQTMNAVTLAGATAYASFIFTNKPQDDGEES